MKTVLDAVQKQRRSLSSGVCLAARAAQADAAILIAKSDQRGSAKDDQHEVLAHWPRRDGGGFPGLVDPEAFCGPAPRSTEGKVLPEFATHLSGGRPQAGWCSEPTDIDGRAHRLLLFWRRPPPDLTDVLAEVTEHVIALLEQEPGDPLVVRRWATFAGVLDTLPTAVVYFESTGTDVVANAQALGMLGLSAQDATPAAVTERMRVLGPALSRAPGPLLVPSERAQFREIDYGERIYTVGSVLLSPDRGGGRLWTLDDITEARRRQNRLFEAKRLAVMGQIAGGVGHEFNNLLGKIIGLAEMAMDHIPEESEAAVELEMLITVAEESAEIVRRLAAYSGGSVAEPRLFDLTDLARTFHAADADRDRAITFNCDVPERSYWVHADDTLVGAAIKATIDNASQWGASRVDLSFAPSPGEDEVEIIIRDDGVGMTPEVMERAFDPFFTTRPVGTGVGLGLSMVRGVMAQLGGRARLAASAGAGATVTLALPLA